MADVSSVVSDSLVVSQRIDYIVDCAWDRALDRYQHQLSNYNPLIGRYSFHFETECKCEVIYGFVKAVVVQIWRGKRVVFVAQQGHISHQSLAVITLCMYAFGWPTSVAMNWLDPQWSSIACYTSDSWYMFDKKFRDGRSKGVHGCSA